jgi:hypothetical protein
MGPIRNPRWEQKRTEGYVIVSSVWRILYLKKNVHKLYLKTIHSNTNNTSSIELLNRLSNRRGGYGFLFRSDFFYRATQELEYLFFLSRKGRIFFQEFNIRLYYKNSNQIIFFSSTKIRIFFSATLGIRIFF